MTIKFASFASALAGFAAVIALSVGPASADIYNDCLERQIPSATVCENDGGSAVFGDPQGDQPQISDGTNEN